MYRDDTYHLILSGLRGGKGVPEDVSAHPRVFATFTAPSFGAVHTRREKAGKTLPCHPRRDDPVCEHGRPQGCRARHADDDPQIGQPICVDCYDYVGAVLWNAHAGELWRRFTQALSAVFARSLGITRAELRRRVRLSYAKVAEYQARGLVHFHAVIRLDGPDGPADAPPDRATVPVLDRAIRQAAGQIAVPVPGGPDGSSLVLGWGRQLDVEPVYLTTDLEGMSDQRVASYIAKYATKGAESAGTVDRPIRHMREVATLDVSEHARRMIYTCFVLANRPEYRGLPLRAWAHMLGYRGHFSTKSRHTRYGSWTYGRRGPTIARQSPGKRGACPILTNGRRSPSEWRYAGSGYRHGEHFWAGSSRPRSAHRAGSAESENDARARNPCLPSQPQTYRTLLIRAIPEPEPPPEA